MKNTIFLLLLCFLGACAKSMEVGNDKTTSTSTPQETQKVAASSLNKARIEHQENVIEVHQEFQQKNEKNEWLSTPHELELRDISFVRMSAFSLDLKGEYAVQFRIFDKGQWGDWTILPESREQANPKRKVFNGLNLFQEIDKIQFRSSSATQSPVVFRLFVAYNQN
ncbi:MAG: hypothetical protein KTR30_17335 [Saprospiraceae bacterium]|nr:hypothetical protein [Saprospiraceae bacterium]